jgi:hypothetical protein
MQIKNTFHFCMTRHLDAFDYAWTIDTSRLIWHKLPQQYHAKHVIILTCHLHSTPNSMGTLDFHYGPTNGHSC